MKIYLTVWWWPLDTKKTKYKILISKKYAVVRNEIPHLFFPL